MENGSLGGGKYLARRFFRALSLSDTAWMEFREGHSLKIQGLGTAKQLQGLHSALTTPIASQESPFLQHPSTALFLLLSWKK